MHQLTNIIQTIFIIWIWGILMISVNPYNWEILETWYEDEDTYLEQLGKDCVSDMVLDWEDPRCDQFRSEGDQEIPNS